MIVRDDYARGALEDDCQISIIVSNVNEAPVFNDISLTIAENSAVSTLVGPALVATDEDGDSLTFSIMSGNTNGAFAITSGGGQVMRLCHVKPAIFHARRCLIFLHLLLQPAFNK